MAWFVCEGRQWGAGSNASKVPMTIEEDFITNCYVPSLDNFDVILGV